jgi:hypothetical protein
VTTNRRASRSARLLAGLTIVAAAGYTASFPVAAASLPPQSDEPTTTTSVPAPDEEQGIIPEPNSGQEPSEAGDRGGALQIAVLAGIVAALALGVTLVIRESRRNLARRSTRPPAARPPTPPA